MNLQEYLANPESKYLVIGKSIWEQNPVAQQIAHSPQCFFANEREYVIRSLDPTQVLDLVSYIESLGEGYAFGWSFNDGKVNFLTHSEALALMQNTPV